MSPNRRQILRGLLGGAAVGVALPPFEAALNTHGDAFAQGAPLPTRFGVWFWGNGVRPEHWAPTGAGAGWSPSAALAPLAPLKAWVSPITGLEIKTATHPHHSGMAGIMTGARYHQDGTTRDTIVSTFARQSVDQDAADWFSGQTPFRSLELGVTRFRGTDEGTTFQHLSHNGPNNPNPSEYDAAALFRRLFGGPTDDRKRQLRRSVLDAVHAQTRDLQRDLGAADRARLDQHLSSIRALEQRLAAGAATCQAGAEPVMPHDDGAFEPVQEKSEIMAELLAMALACDLTRAFSVQFSTCGSGVVFWQVGSTTGMHSLCHTEALPQPVVQEATVFTMEQLAIFLAALERTPEGATHLLDRCSILCTSELSDGYTHSNQDFPLLLCGGGGGRLQPGRHVRFTHRDNASRAVLTALHGAGVALPSWGVDAGATSSPIGELIA